MGELYRRLQEDPTIQPFLRDHNFNQLEEPYQTYLEQLITSGRDYIRRSLGRQHRNELLEISNQTPETFSWFLRNIQTVAATHIQSASNNRRRRR